MREGAGPRTEAREDLQLDSALPESHEVMLSGYFIQHFISTVLFEKS